MSQASAPTPMFRQYRALKNDHPEAVLLFRMGDFYEMFFEDAKVASRLLDLTLTARGKGTDNVVPMCGFPHHQLESYTARLVRADCKVAVCEQTEDPKKAKGLVRREVVRVVTPGTVTDISQLDSKTNSWIVSVASHQGCLGAAFLDVSTGEFLAWQSSPEDLRPWDALAERLDIFRPRELLVPDDLEWPATFREEKLAGKVETSAEAYLFTPPVAGALLERHFGVASLDGFGMRERPAAVAAGGGLVQHLLDTQKCGLEHVSEILYHEPAHAMLLDPATRRNLELERSIRDGGRRGSLFHAIDLTMTPAGGRLLRRWVLEPLLDPKEIGRRHDTVEELLARPELRGGARDELKRVHDIERLVARAVAGTANPRELVSLRESLRRVPELLRTFEDARSEVLRRTLDDLDPCADVTERLGLGLVDDPPATLRDGGVIREGFHADLDELIRIRRDGKGFIASLEASEREATGIASLKVRYNKVFGYFIEVSRANLHLAPEHYHRKQTVSTGERFVTPELKEHESKVLNAQERIESLELELFQEMRVYVAKHAHRLKRVARAIATVDVLAGLAELAAVRDYRRPVVGLTRGLAITGGRHPVVEQFLPDGRFVPNDTHLGEDEARVAVLTGPNMGGKSTYLRQVALIVILAQAGSFVPAEAAEIGVADRVFCRVGASDSLSEGQSTFMVEMAETANILHHATSASLVLLDEIGRGTSTFDGLSIAWAVVEHLHDLSGGAPRTLFATHYHELTELAVELPAITNLRMSVREWGDDVVFLHRVENGAADRSYGIQVARLAGVPAPVVSRAKEILTNLERDEYGRDGLPRRARRPDGSVPGEQRRQTQPSLFEREPPPSTPPAGIEILDEVAATDTDRLTPIDALTLLAGWKRRIRDESP